MHFRVMRSFIEEMRIYMKKFILDQPLNYLLPLKIINVEVSQKSIPKYRDQLRRCISRIMVLIILDIEDC